MGGQSARMKDSRWTKRCTEWQPKEREEIKGMTNQKMARRHNKEEGNHIDQESNRPKTMEDIDVGLHPAVDEQSLG